MSKDIHSLAQAKPVYPELFGDSNLCAGAFLSKIGTMAGLTVGFAFGMGAIGRVVIEIMLDVIGVYTTMIVMSFLPIMGIFAF